MPDPKLQVQIGATTTELERALAKATKSLQKFSDKSKALGKSFQSAGKKMTVGLTLPIGILAGAALKAASNLETLETSLSVMTGSAEKGKAIMKDLIEFTARTPFQLEGVGNTAKALLAFGFTTEKVKENLQLLGDVAAGSGNDLGSLGQIFGQIAAAGKLTGERLNQLQERAVPIGPALAKTMGVAESSIKKMVENGQISFADFEKAFRSLSEKGGLFVGAMDKQSKTLAGIFSTLKDNVNIALGDLGNEIVEAFDLKQVSEDLIKEIQRITKWFSELDSATKKSIVKWGLFIAALGPIITAIGAFATIVLPGLVTIFTFISATVLPAVIAGFTTLNATMLANPIVAIGVAIGLLVVGFSNLLQSISPVVGKLKTLWNLIISGFDHAKFIELQMRDVADAMEQTTIESKRAAREARILAMNQDLAADKAAKLAKNLLAVAKASNVVAAARSKVAGVQATPQRGITDTSGGIKGKDPVLAGKTPTTIIDEEAENMQLALMNFNDRAGEIINGGIASTFAGLGAAIGESLANGGNALEGGAAALLGGVGSIMVQLGELAIGIGLGLEAIKASLESLNPVVAIAAGIALVALGSIFKSQASSMGGGIGGATGGSGGGSSFSGSSSSSFSTNSDGGTYVFEIAGTKLVGVLKNTLDRNKALGGSNNLLFQ